MSKIKTQGCPIFLLLLFLTSTLHHAPKALANETDQFISIVNPVRIAPYTIKPALNIKTQYEILKDLNLHATWLLTYDALSNNSINATLKSMDNTEEFGIFLEITPALANAAKVEYNNTGKWHHATSLFLTGYTQEAREKLIDAVFEKFNQELGYYPTSVGSWWTDSYSLEYMSNKYKITANLGVSDQFSTDRYQVWGQYWSTPFYPSKTHAGIPATNKENKLNLVTTQWAAREPLNGYQSSLYSTQDYGSIGQTTTYFEKLVSLYTQKHDNQFGHITVGLESDLTPDNYNGEFKKQMEVVSTLIKTLNLNVSTMRQFSKWYRKKFPDLSPPQTIESDDLTKKAEKKAIWYQSTKYRIGIEYDRQTSNTKIIDLRTYHKDLQEPYYKTPNKEFDLSIYIPSLLDEINYKEDIWNLELGRLEATETKNDKTTLTFSRGKILLSPEEIEIKGNKIAIPIIIKESPHLNLSQNGSIKIQPKKNWIANSENTTIKNLTLEATHFIKTKRVKLALTTAVGIFLILTSALFKSRAKTSLKFLIPTTILGLSLILIQQWYDKNTMTYSFSQSEVDALFHLSTLPKGKVVVLDRECLQCPWYTKHKPAVFANKRSYVKKLGKHPIVYNASIFNAETREAARKEFKKTRAQYIYLVKYGEYIEKAPFSPGDLGIEKLYDNANAEIWKAIDKN